MKCMVNGGMTGGMKNLAGLERKEDVIMLLNQLKIPSQYPSKGAADTLRQSVLEVLKAGNLQAGDRFLTDQELVERTKLSASTVRRALKGLQRDGWISRRAGSGTFVGERVAISAEETRISRLGHLAVVVGASSHGGAGLSDWLFDGVVSGISRAASENNLSLEVLSGQLDDLDNVANRLQGSNPDAAICLSSKAVIPLVIRELLRLQIPWVTNSSQHEGLGGTFVSEDNQQGAQLAVDHLVNAGHRRIALAVCMNPSRWVFERLEGYSRALEAQGVEVDQNLICWLPARRGYEHFAESVDVLDSFIIRQKPTAVICGSYSAMQVAGSLVQSQRVQIPRDLSLLSFDQHPEAPFWMQGQQPATVALPLEEIGRELTNLSLAMIQGRAIKPSQRIPCRLVPGCTVRQIDHL